MGGMNRIAQLVSLPLAIFALVACGSEESSEESDENSSGAEETAAASPPQEEEPDEVEEEEPEGEEPDAESIAEALLSDVETVTDYTVITEDNDPNDLIGRPNGYVGAAVLHDSEMEMDCEGLGIDCGATVEIWADEDAASGRSAYIQDTLEDAQILGTEYHFQSGSTLLRVAGELTPSHSETYEVAFADVME